MADIPATCKAALHVAHGQPMEIGDVKVPDKLEYNSILVRTTAATICASDVHAWEGDMTTAASRFPVILGHEMTGRVARLGDGVTHDSVGQPLAEGDRIIWTHGFCGQCLNCTIEHEPTLCTNRRGYMGSLATEYPYLTGGFAEYCYVFPTSGRVKVPDEVSDELASAAACALRTVVHAFDRLGPIDDRQTVVIQGSGPLGLFALAKAVRGGASQIIVIGGPAQRLQVARKWGATRTLDIADMPEAADRQQQIMEWTNGYGADIVVEMSGAHSAFPEGLDLLRRGGRYLVVGQLHGRSVSMRPVDVTRKHARIIGCASASVPHYWRALEFIRNNKERFSWDDLISNHYPLEQINEAMTRMRAWQEVKPALTFNGGRN